LHIEAAAHGEGDEVRSRLVFLCVAVSFVGTMRGQSKSFWALTASQAAATAIDGWQTAQPGREVGTPWLYGNYPCAHQARLALTLGSEAALGALTGKLMQHTRFRRLWALPQGYMTGIHAQAAARNWGNPYVPIPAVGCR
jgi:hypothetical protein